MPPPTALPAGGALRRSGRTNTAAEKAQARQVSLRRIGGLFVGFRGQLAAVTAIIFVSSVISMASPFLLRAVIDQALPRRDVHLLAWLVIGMVAVATVTSAFGVIQTWISTRVGQQIMHRLRTQVFTHLQRQSLGFFTQTRTGEVQSRITNDIGGMESVVTDTATSIAQNLTIAIATVVAMVALSWRLSLVSLVVLPPAIYLTRKVARMRREITAQRQRELADLNVTIEEGLSISGVHLSKTMGATAALNQRFAASSSRLIDLELRSELAGRWRMASMSIIFAAIPAILYLNAGLPGTAGTLTIGTARGVRSPADRPLPAADGPAERRRGAHQLPRPVRTHLRVPRPAGRGRRPRTPARGRPARRPRPPASSTGSPSPTRAAPRRPWTG